MNLRFPKSDTTIVSQQNNYFQIHKLEKQNFNFFKYRIIRIDEFIPNTYIIHLTVDNEVLGFEKEFCSGKVKDFYVYPRIDWVNGVISNTSHLHDNYERDLEDGEVEEKAFYLYNKDRFLMFQKILNEE